LAAPIATNGSDTLGVESENPNGLAVVHFDTEQSREDFWNQVARAVRRAGREQTPPWLLSYTLTDFPAKQKREAVWMAADHAAKEFGGLHSIIVDGFADLVCDVNDAEECNEFVAALHALAIKHNCPIVGVIHFNPGSEKTRGHLGSQLERKAETNLRIDKDGEVSHVWSEKQRRAPILEGTGPRFQWSEELAMHVTVESRESAKKKAATEEAKRLRDDVFGDKRSMRYTDLKNGVMDITGKSDRSAKRIVEDWVKLGVIEQSIAKLWTPRD
jgi:hypothetical protein